MYNQNLRKAVKDLKIKKAVSTISSDLNVNPGSVSSYLNGRIKASDPFLEKFANFYKVPIDSITDPLADSDLSLEGFKMIDNQKQETRSQETGVRGSGGKLCSG